MYCLMHVCWTAALGGPIIGTYASEQPTRCDVTRHCSIRRNAYHPLLATPICNAATMYWAPQARMSIFQLMAAHDTGFMVICTGDHADELWRCAGLPIAQLVGVSLGRPGSLHSMCWVCARAIAWCICHCVVSLPVILHPVSLLSCEPAGGSNGVDNGSGVCGRAQAEHVPFMGSRPTTTLCHQCCRPCTTIRCKLLCMKHKYRPALWRTDLLELDGYSVSLGQSIYV
jgi:hypothetical protein